MSVSINDSMVGQVIAFQSKNVNDAQTWQGKIEASRCTSKIASRYRDLVSYNNAVRLFDPTVSSDITQLNYFILTTTDSLGNSSDTAFAEEWITDNSFNVITQDKTITVQVMDSPGNVHSNIVNILRQNGYSATIVDIS